VPPQQLDDLPDSPNPAPTILFQTTGKVDATRAHTKIRHSSNLAASPNGRPSIAVVVPSPPGIVRGGSNATVNSDALGSSALTEACPVTTGTGNSSRGPPAAYRYVRRRARVRRASPVRTSKCSAPHTGSTVGAPPFLRQHHPKNTVNFSRRLTTARRLRVGMAIALSGVPSEHFAGGKSLLRYGPPHHRTVALGSHRLDSGLSGRFTPTTQLPRHESRIILDGNRLEPSAVRGGPRRRLASAHARTHALTAKGTSDAYEGSSGRHRWGTATRPFVRSPT